MEFTKEDEIVFEKFFLLKEKRQFKRALKVLDLLASKYKDNREIHGLYGLSYFELNDFKNSAKHFGKVITINPNSELASLGLYVSLVHIGKDRKALKELFRYTETNEPKLYIVTIKELMEENMDGIGFKTDRKKIQGLYKKWHCQSYGENL
jgi:tetratricopeptide (TPR) repeat protein